jgi:hypothetical protein
MGAKGGFSKALLKSINRFPGGFRRNICASQAALEQLLCTTVRGFRESVKNVKHFARGKIKLSNSI